MPSTLLRCIICPREPDFSDVSHLLTHVASKGHLAHYFKTQVRCRDDESVRKKFDAYNEWYAEHQIESLLSKRMRAKATKGKKVARQTLCEPDGNDKASKRRGPQRKRNKRQSTSPSGEEPKSPPLPIDPKLSRANRSFDHIVESPSFQAASRHWKQSLRSSGWIDGSLPTPSSYDDEESGQFEGTFANGTGSIASDNRTHPFPRANISPKLSNEMDDEYVATMKKNKERSNGSTVSQSPMLKGTKYPGMALFDSASAEAQRLRNQKKDVSTLMQLEVEAASIQQLEHIYWPDGKLKKSRVITGNVESSPNPEISPPQPKITRPRRRKPLGEISVNISRRRRTGRQQSIPVRQDAIEKSKSELGQASYAMNDIPMTRPIQSQTSNMEKAHGKYLPSISHDDDESFVKMSQVNGSSVYRSPSESGTASELFLRSESNLEELPRIFLEPSLMQRVSQSSSPPSSSIKSVRRSIFFDYARTPTRARRDTPSSGARKAVRASIEEGWRVEHGNDHGSLNYGQQVPLVTSMPSVIDFDGFDGSFFMGTSLNPLNPSIYRHRQYMSDAPEVCIDTSPLAKARL